MSPSNEPVCDINITTSFLVDRYGHLIGCFWLFPLKFDGGGKDLQMVLCDSMKVGSVVGTLKPYLIQRICLNFAHTDRKDVKNFDVSACATSHIINPARKQRFASWNFHYLILVEFLAPFAQVSFDLNGVNLTLYIRLL